MRKILIIGASGSGKSQTTRLLLRDSPLPTFVINDRDSQHGDYIPLEFDQVLTKSDCNVVVEDLIDCTPAQLSVLQTLCNYNARHNRIATTILVAHSVTKNGIAALLQYLTHVLFMTTRSTVSSLSYVLTHYRFAKSVRAGMQDRFLRDVAAETTGRRYGHWVLDVERGTFERAAVVTSQQQLLQPESSTAAAADGAAAPPPLEERDVQARRTAETYIPLFADDERHGNRALAVFDYILAGMSDRHHLDSASLEFHFRGTETGKPRRLSLLDYVVCVTSATAELSPDVLSLHGHLSRQQALTLPRCFVRNKDPRLLP
jgi:hypothetical protein